MTPRLRLILLLACAPLAAQQPPVSNAKLETKDGASLKAAVTAAASRGSAVWIGYAVSAAQQSRGGCCCYESWNGGSGIRGCALEGGKPAAGAARKGPIELEGSTQMMILLRAEGGAVHKIRAFAMDCDVDAGGLPFVWLTGVNPGQSIAMLKQYAIANGELRDGAVFAVAMHAGAAAEQALIDLVQPSQPEDLRRKTLFWLAQRAGQKALGVIERAIESDPDTQIKKQAVFALTQLPPDDGVPALITVARNNRNREVRRQAFFWLGQSADPRAARFLEEVLTSR